MFLYEDTVPLTEGLFHLLVSQTFCGTTFARVHYSKRLVSSTTTSVGFVLKILFVGAGSFSFDSTANIYQVGNARFLPRNSIGTIILVRRNVTRRVNECTSCIRRLARGKCTIFVRGVTGRNGSGRSPGLLNCFKRGSNCGGLIGSLGSICSLTGGRFPSGGVFICNRSVNSFVIHYFSYTCPNTDRTSICVNAKNDGPTTKVNGTVSGLVTSIGNDACGSGVLSGVAFNDCGGGARGGAPFS